jgi:hypothetical protein
MKYPVAIMPLLGVLVALHLGPILMAAGNDVRDEDHASSENIPLIPPAWKTAPQRPLTPQELDQLLAERMQAEGRAYAAPIDDALFVRRVSLHLTGKLPPPAEVEAFLESADPDKRRHLIDRLLASEDFARHWARYWRDVFLSQAADEVRIQAARLVATEYFLKDQFLANRSWAQIARTVITSQGHIRTLDPLRGGDAGLLLARLGSEAAMERAADTARVFLGLQIQCAQCHDHPTDVWKRRHFHELAAFYGRLREQQTGGMGMGPGFQLASAEEGEYRMPDQDDPNQSTVLHPRFLTGEALGEGKSDQERRQALADLVTSKDNYWFSAAFVNRIWGELMGQAFYQPVDHLGPLQEATYPEVLLRLADSFRATDYNIQELFRLITNSRAYQQSLRMGNDPAEHLRFSGLYPTQFRAEVVWDCLVGAVGTFYEEPNPVPGNLRAILERIRNPDFKTVFKRVFNFDPSTPSNEVEGSVPRILMLMNNPLITARMQATGDTPLARILAEHADDQTAVRKVYLQALGRPPTAREWDICQTYLRQAASREEGFEDILWALINSTEFQTHR